MAKKFFGEYKDIGVDQLPVFNLSITVQDFRSGKMSAHTSTFYYEVGTCPSYAHFMRIGLAKLRKAVSDLKELSDKAYRKPKALLTAGTGVTHA